MIVSILHDFIPTFVSTHTQTLEPTHSLFMLSTITMASSLCAVALSPCKCYSSTKAICRSNSQQAMKYSNMCITKSLNSLFRCDRGIKWIGPPDLENTSHYILHYTSIKLLTRKTSVEYT